MANKRVLTVGAIMVAAATSAPTTAMLVPGGVRSDAPPEPPLIEVTEPVDPSVPPSTAILDLVTAPTVTVSKRPSRRLDPARDPVATPPPEQTPPQDPADQPPSPAAPAEPTETVPEPQPAGQPTEEATRPVPPPTFPPDEPDPADTVVLPPPSFPEDDDPADQ
jgi:hypothetical protein